MSNVIEFTGFTKLPIPVENVLEGAKTAKDVLVISVDENDEFCVAASHPDIYYNLYLALQMAHNVLNGTYDTRD